MFVEIKFLLILIVLLVLQNLFSHFTLFRVECEQLFCTTNIKLLKF